MIVMAFIITSATPVAAMAAEIIGIHDPDVVRDVIELSNNAGYMIHGRRQSSFYSVQQNGILPMTPEGGGVSYWNAGSRIFGVPDGERLLTRDSTVFNYAHSGDATKNYVNVAVARHSDLRRAGLITDEFTPDDYVIMGRQVPRPLIHLLHMESGAIEGREEQRKMERHLTEALRDIFRHGYRPGTLQFGRC